MNDDDSINLDQLLKSLDERFKVEYNDYFYNKAGAATITTAAGNSWPYVSTGTDNYTLTNTSNGTLSHDWNFAPQKQSLQVKGDAEFEGDIKLKGKSLSETLDKIEQRLAILHPNEHLESKWEELKKLGDAYRALEKDIIEKENIWKTLKK